MQRRVVFASTNGSTTYSSDRPKKSHRIEEYVPTRKAKEEEHEGIPLELMPTIRTLKGYGRRMNALGALRVARALERVVDNIMPHIGKYPELVDIILEAKHEADSIRSSAIKEASGEQDDGDSQEDR